MAERGGLRRQQIGVIRHQGGMEFTALRVRTDPVAASASARPRRLSRSFIKKAVVVASRRARPAPSHALAGVCAEQPGFAVGVKVA